ncbi:MAG TPA: hypothetical protein VMF66_17775 [Candidatus Acidoferrum sp.]|nr:hypothetical protein [Candidatus Acidoferrum sp.]
MSLASGTKVGSYEILTAIGAGGTGEVYRARDAKLGRDVAIRCCRRRSRDAERMARFVPSTKRCGLLGKSPTRWSTRTSARSFIAT